MRAIDSADRMTQSLSPWVREMLNSGNAPTTGGSLVHRLMRRRADESVSFLSTLAILRRFHRIATRTSAWKANVGTISPNLFEKFSEVMFKNWDMGANNITALLKINRQEEAIDMPLAGEVGGPAAAQPRPPANPMAGMTMEEIRRRVEEARKFESMSPSAVPNFVKSQDTDKPEVRPVGQHPGSRPTPAPQRPTDQPIARQLQDTPPPTPPTAQQPPQQPPSPRMMRRRMARQVEYLSMPAVEGSDGGNESSNDGGDMGGSGDSEAGPNQQFDTGPPGLDWLFPEPENIAPDWFTPTADEEMEAATLRRTLARNPSTQRARSRAMRAPSSSVPATSVRRALQPTPVRAAHRPARPRRPLSSLSAMAARPRPQGIVQRAFERLTASASGQLLASRPHLLLDHIQRQSSAPAQQPRPAAPALSPTPGASAVDALSFGPEPASTFALQPREDAYPALASVSLADFALPYPRRLWQGRELPQAALPAATDAQPTLTNQPTQPAPAAPVPRRVARPRLQSSLAQPPASPAVPRRQAAAPQPQPRQSSQPVARNRALAVLQTQPLRPSPTVMRLVSAPPIGLSSVSDPHVLSPARPRPARGQAQSAADDQRSESDTIFPQETDALPVLPEIRHAFEPVSGLWRSPLLRSQPIAPTPLAEEMGGTSSLLSTAGLPTPGLPIPEMIVGEERLRRVPQTTPSPVKTARAFLLPLDLAPLQRAATAPPRTPAQAVVQPTVEERSVAPGRATVAQAASLRPLRALVERVIRRDFAGARADLLRAGPLAFPERDVVPAQATPRPVAGGVVSRRAAPDFPARSPAFVQRHTATDSPVPSSPQAQTRLLMQRAAATDEWPPQRSLSFLRRPQGLRPPAPPVQRALSPAPVAPMKAAVASVPPRQAIAARMRLGETGTMAQDWAALRPRLEPASRLWRSALLLPAPPFSEQAVPTQNVTQFSAFVAEPLQADISSAPASPPATLSPRPNAQPGVSTELPLVSPLRVARTPVQAVATPEAQGDLLVDRLSVHVPPRRISHAPRTRDVARPVGAADASPLSARTVLAGQGARAASTLLERVARRVTPQTTPRPQVQRIGRNAPLAEIDQPIISGEISQPVPERVLPPLPATRGGERRTDGLPRPLLSDTLPARLAARPAPRLLQRSHRPGQTGQDAARLGIRRRQALALAPVSSAWETEPHITERTMGARTTAALSGADSTLPMAGLPDSLGNAFSFALPLADFAAAGEGTTAATQPVSWPALPLRQEGVRRAVGRESSPPLPPTGETAVAAPQTAAGSNGRQSIRQIIRRTAPVRPLSQQLLRRDFAHTRRETLFAGQVTQPVDLELPSLRPTGRDARVQTTTEFPLQRMSFPVGEARNTRPANPLRPTAGLALTSTLLELTRQPAHRFGLPRLRPMGVDTHTQTTDDLPLQRTYLQERPTNIAPRARATAPLRPATSTALTNTTVAAITTAATPPELTRELLNPAEETGAPVSPQPTPLPPLVLRWIAPVDIARAGEARHRLSGDATDQSFQPVRARPLPLPPGGLARAVSGQMDRQQIRRRVEPVSELWRSVLLHDEPVSAVPAGRDVAGPVAISGDDLLALGGLQRTLDPVPVAERNSAPAASAVFAPLELALNRLLGGSGRGQAPPLPSTSAPPVQGVAAAASGERRAANPVAPRVSRQTAGQAVQRLEAGGWRFKRSRLASAAPVESVQRALTGLAAGGSRPIPERPRTLLERVLQRDFAGVRVQMVSLGPLGIEAAARGTTVFLNREQARLDRPDSLALLGHELTHVAASGAAPLLDGQSVQRMAEPSDGDAAAVLPLAPSLSRRLSRQLVQMSLADEERTAEVVESVVRRGVDSPTRSRTVQRRRAEPSRRGGIDGGSRTVAELAQRRLATSHFDPVSQSWPGLSFAHAPEAASESSQAQTRVRSRDRLELLEDVGWRFKRSEQPTTAQTADVQRAEAELTALPAGGMPLPLRPRTLMERVLQRDFSGVRLQAAGLAPLGVEAAARGQTVYLQRSALAQLERPDNLALLGHELTHVAAASNPPVRRSELNGGALAAGESPVPLPLSLPPISQLQRSVAHEESAASSVEKGIQTLLRQSTTVQRDPLAPRPANGPVKANGAGQTSDAVAGNGAGSSVTRPGMSTLPVAQRRAVQGRVLSSIGASAVQRAQDQESVMAGVDSGAMPVVQRSVGRVSSMADASPAMAPAQTNVYVSRFASPGVDSPVQRTLTEDSGVSETNNDTMDDSGREEPDWDRLAERIYPLIVRMIRMERERRPL